MTNAIEVAGLKKYFTDFKIRSRKVVRAVDGISFKVKKGEVFGFLGPNGAGKTTTIRCLMDFIRPTVGSIKLFGDNAHEKSVSLKKKIGYLPGNVQLYDKWTGQEHVDFIESLKGRSKDANDLIKRFDFDPHRKFKHYSSGNKQKLGLILALMHEPKLIVMDEPTIGLDPLLQNEIYEIFDELQKKARTIFVSSHNLPEVERICDRVGIIREGKLVGVEKVGELAEKRLRRIVVRFETQFEKEIFKFDGVDYELESFWRMAILGFLFALAIFSISMLATSILSEKGKSNFTVGGVIILMYVINVICCKLVQSLINFSIQTLTFRNFTICSKGKTEA